MKRARAPAARARAAACLVSLAFLAGGCAYYNTFYSARRNFSQAEKLYRNPDDRASPQQLALYDKALQSATKVVVNYPRSKWVDDAVLLMGRALLGKGDYEKARLKFDELAANFPDSPLRDEALFYKAESYRRERKWPEAQAVLDTLQLEFPKSELRVPAALRRGQMLAARRQPRDAVAALTPLVGHEPDERFALDLRLTLADAYHALASYDTARVHYAWVADHARSEELAHQSVLRQGDSFEGARDFAGAARLYLEYEQETPRSDYADQARIRRAFALARGGDAPAGMSLLERMATERGATPIAGEALFRMGYIQEVLLDDLAAARATYAKVHQEFRATPFAGQAEQRMQNIEKIEALRAEIAADTTGREQAAAAAFAVAERFYFDADRPERALEEYARVESLFADTDFGPKAAFAAAWVLDRQLERPVSADSAWQRLLTRYPESIFGRAASAYLRGREDSLRTPGPLEPTLLTYPVTPGASPYTPPRVDIRALRAAQEAAARQTAAADSARRGAAAADSARRGAAPDTTHRGAAAPDTARAAAPDTARAAPADTTRRLPAPLPSPSAPRDTSRTPSSPPDSTAPAARDTTRRPER